MERRARRVKAKTKSNRMRRLTLLLSRNWREKLLALALAFLFWYLVKSQAVVERPYWVEPKPFPVRGQL